MNLHHFFRSDTSLTKWTTGMIFLKVQAEQASKPAVALTHANWLRWEAVSRTFWHLILDTVVCVFHVSVLLRPLSSQSWGWSYTWPAPHFEFTGNFGINRLHAVMGNKEAIAKTDGKYWERACTLHNDAIHIYKSRAYVFFWIWA